MYECKFEQKIRDIFLCMYKLVIVELISSLILNKIVFHIDLSKTMS